MHIQTLYIEKSICSFYPARQQHFERELKLGILN